MKDYAKWFYKSTAWKKCRQSYYVFRHGLCERCQQPGDVVHHITHITPENINDPSITLSHDNLELLCHECHNHHHKAGDSVREDVMFDEQGNLIERR